MMKTPSFFLDGNNTVHALLPLLSLGKDTARLNPKLSTSPMARKINLVGQTKPIIRRDLQRYQIMHITIQRRTKYFSQINSIINPQFIISRQTHRKKVLHQIYLKEHRGEHGIENQRERRSHLATSYGPVGLWWTTHASSEGQQS